MLHANIPSYKYLYSQLQAGKQQKYEEGEQEQKNLFFHSPYRFHKFKME